MLTGLGGATAELVCIWTMATPKAKKNRDIHLVDEIDLRRSMTEKAAVVRIFI
jgi:hypothetical protein